MLQLRLMEKKRKLVRWVNVDTLVDGIAGVVLTHERHGGAVLERFDGVAQDRRGGV